MSRRRREWVPRDRSADQLYNFCGKHKRKTGFWPTRSEVMAHFGWRDAKLSDILKWQRKFCHEQDDSPIIASQDERGEWVYRPDHRVRSVSHFVDRQERTVSGLVESTINVAEGAGQQNDAVGSSLVSNIAFNKIVSVARVLDLDVARLTEMFSLVEIAELAERFEAVDAA